MLQLQAWILLPFWNSRTSFYVLLSASSHRCEGMCSKNCQESNRWDLQRATCCRVGHQKPLRYETVIDVIETFTNHNVNADTKGKASTTLAVISTFQFLCFLNLWGNFLPEVDSTGGFREEAVGHAPKMPKPLVAILLCASRFSAPSASRPNLAPANFSVLIRHYTASGWQRPEFPLPTKGLGFHQSLHRGLPSLTGWRRRTCISAILDIYSLLYS